MEVGLAFIQIIFSKDNTPDDDNSCRITTKFLTATQSIVTYETLLKKFCGLVIANQNSINTEIHR